MPSLVGSEMCIRDRDTTVQVIRKRKDGNSYVVSAPDGNTYIRGRRLLKPISSPNTSEETTKEIQQQTATGAKEDSAKRMPRRSPRNHVSTRAADIEIAARITAIYIRDLEDGSDILNTGSGCDAQGQHRQSYK